MRKLHTFIVAVAGCQVKGCHPLGGRGIDLCPLVQEDPEQAHIAVQCQSVQCRFTLLIFFVYIGAVGDQKQDYVASVLLRKIIHGGIMKWSKPYFVLLIDLCALFNKGPHDVKILSVCRLVKCRGPI